MEELWNIIDGSRRKGTGSGRIRVENPATEQTVGWVEDSSEADVDAAITAAREASAGWAAVPAKERAETVVRAFEAVAAQPDLADLVVGETGHPIRLTEAFHVGAPLQWATELARLASSVESREIAAWPGEGSRSHVHYHPYGVVGMMTPFNAPLLLTAWKLVPALVLGNTVVAKPSETAPFAVGRLYEAFREAGTPPGVVNVVHGGVAAASHLAAHAGLDKLTFTGSTATGRKIAAAAGAQLTPLVLELGGKSPAVILEGSDTELAAQAVIAGAVNLNGQTCGALTRVLVHSSLASEVVDRLADLSSKLRVGDPRSDATDVGPLNSRAQVEFVKAMVDQAREDGARVLTGGSPANVEGRGYYFEPAVLDRVDNRWPIAQTELFGPVVTVSEFNDTGEAIRLANDSEYGLVASVFGQDVRAIERVAAGLKTGTVWINDMGPLSPLVPFGGFKHSGIGRELGMEGMLEYVQAKHAYHPADLELSGRPYRHIGSAW